MSKKQPDNLRAALKAISRPGKRLPLKERVWQLECEVSLLNYALTALIEDMKRRRRNIPDIG